MGKTGFLILILVLLFSTRPLCAQDEEETGLRPGMELIKIGSINTIVPEGSEIYKRNGVYILEAPEEYAARRFKEMEGRLAQFEENLENTEKNLEKLVEEIETLKTDLSSFTAPPSETAEGPPGI